MKGSEIVKTALVNAGKTQNELAEFLGMSKQNLSYRMVSDAFSLDEIEKAQRRGTGKDSGHSREYIMSMKDMCTLTILPDLIEAGID